MDEPAPGVAVQTWQTATGDALDHIAGMLWALKRDPGESDLDLREKIRRHAVLHNSGWCF